MLSQDVEDWYPFLETPLAQTKHTGQTIISTKFHGSVSYIKCPIRDSIRFYTLFNSNGSGSRVANESRLLNFLQSR